MPTAGKIGMNPILNRVTSSTFSFYAVTRRPSNLEVEGFPAFNVTDDKGNDFFTEVATPVALG